MRRTVEKHITSYQDLHKNHSCWNPEVDFTNVEHRSALAFIESEVFTQEWFDGCYRFAFVRNSWDRLVSLWEYLRSFRLRRKQRPSNRFLLDFGDFVREVCSRSRYVRPLDHKNVRDLNQANSQLEWLKWGIDFVGRFENLHEDWRRLCNEIEMPHYPLEHFGATSRRDFRSYYTIDLRRRVAEFYAEEIERFDFKFD